MIGFYVAMALVLIGGFAGLTIARKNYDPKDSYDADIYKRLGTIRTIAVIVVLLITVLVTVIASIRIVDQTEVGVVRTFGRIDHEIYGGLNMVNPITQTVTIYDLTTHMGTANFATYTKDAQPVTASVDFQYRLKNGEVMDVARQFGSYEAMEMKLTAVVEEKVKAVFAKYGGMSLLENRAQLSDEVLMAMKELEQTYHVEFINAVVNNIDFSDAFEASVEAKMTAEQEALRAEQEKKTAIVNAEKTREVARIEAEAAVAAAEGEANAAVARANGEAESMRIIREALEQMPDYYIQQLWIEKWNGQLPAVQGGGDSSVIINPYDMAPVIGMND